MKKNNQPKNAREALDFMADSLANNTPLDIDDLKQELIESGLNPNKAIARVREIVKRKQKELRLAWQKEAIEKRSLFFARLKPVAGTLPNTIEGLRNRIKALLSGGEALEPQLQASFRKLESMSDEELKTMLEDMELLNNSALE